MFFRLIFHDFSGTLPGTTFWRFVQDLLPKSAILDRPWRHKGVPKATLGATSSAKRRPKAVSFSLRDALGTEPEWLNGVRSTSGSVFPFFIENDAKINQTWYDYGSIWVALTLILTDSGLIFKPNREKTTSHTQPSNQARKLTKALQTNVSTAAGFSFAVVCTSRPCA